MVWPPSLMVWSVTEDSSLVAFSSHLSGALASGAFASLSCGCAERRIACAHNKNNTAAHSHKIFFIALSPPVELDCVASPEPARLYVGGAEESKEGEMKRVDSRQLKVERDKARRARPLGARGKHAVPLR